MAETVPSIDFASLPAPNEGILVALFITIRKVARSRDFYSRVLGGTVVMDENPCIVKLSNSWIIMNPGGPPTPDNDVAVVITSDTAESHNTCHRGTECTPVGMACARRVQPISEPAESLRRTRHSHVKVTVFSDRRAEWRTRVRTLVDRSRPIRPFRVERRKGERHEPSSRNPAEHARR